MKVLVGFCILAVAFARQDGCGPHQTFDECGTLCPLTCDNYQNPPKVCGLMCVPGCHCDEGYVLNKDKRCVKTEECAAKANPVDVGGVDEFCLAEQDPGWCKGNFRRWYYDAQTETCRRFVYGGCQGNKNQYETKQECVKRCKGVKSQRPKILPELCKASANSGNCSAFFVRFYFDSITGQCRRFFYSGCNGNRNNFKTLRECNRTCT
ncbi:hypothetical protein JTE90_026062 [Oedothorax gibbosus]|uniref:BPTI/Kunitz inhibitor domain-containing protein n=1 Tax=Oedothorax gibbosus TaxID=931172 RepID=A0AAV6UD24_9ARAC|nr:hypothetical protein JTE90_026062 [Oedothorax gibbosus]